MTTRTDRIRGLMLKPLLVPTPLLVLLLVFATAAQVWFNSRFGIVLVMTGVILSYCVPSKTAGQGFWTFRTHTVWGVPLLVVAGATAGVAITLVSFLVKVVVFCFFGAILVYLVIKLWRNQDKLKQAFGSVRSFGQ